MISPSPHARRHAGLKRSGFVVFLLPLRRALAGTGGLLAADPNCTSVAFSRSNFTSNAAPAGAVAFFSGWLAANGAAAAQPACTGGCVLRNNSADMWGGFSFAATDIQSASIALSRTRLSSGSAFTAAFTLLDGFGVPVVGRLIGATITASCNTTGALTGTLVASYNSNSSRFDDLKMIGPQGLYALEFSVAGAAAAAKLLPSPIVARTSVRVVECTSTENFDPQSGTCLCIPNSLRNAAGDCVVRAPAAAPVRRRRETGCMALCRPS